MACLWGHWMLRHDYAESNVVLKVAAESEMLNAWQVMSRAITASKCFSFMSNCENDSRRGVR